MKAVIFDMDGVLVNSEPVIIEASLRVLKEHGVVAKESDFLEFTGMGDAKFIGGVAAKYGLEYEDSMKERAYEIYLEIIDEHIKKFPGVLPLLNCLRDKGYTLAIASASDLIKVEANIKAFGGKKEWFKAIITGSDVERKKPFPDIYLKAAAAIGIEPAECLVVEDALSGITAAKTAGMKCVGVSTSFPRETLEESEADYVFDDIFQVTSII